MQYALVLLLLLATSCVAPSYFRLKKDLDPQFTKNGNEIFKVKASCENRIAEMQIQTSSQKPQTINLNTLIKSDSEVYPRGYTLYDKNTTNWPTYNKLEDKKEVILQISQGDILEIRLNVDKSKKGYSFQLQKPFVNNPTIICEYTR